MLYIKLYQRSYVPELKLKIFLHPALKRLASKHQSVHIHESLDGYWKKKGTNSSLLKLELWLVKESRVLSTWFGLMTLLLKLYRAHIFLISFPVGRIQETTRSREKHKKCTNVLYQESIQLYTCIPQLQGETSQVQVEMMLQHCIT